MVQECEDVASGSRYTQSRISAVDERCHSAGSRGCGLQHERRKVEKQCEEVVEHILEIEGGKIQSVQKDGGQGGKVIGEINQEMCLSFSFNLPQYAVTGHHNKCQRKKKKNSLEVRRLL